MFIILESNNVNFNNRSNYFKEASGYINRLDEVPSQFLEYDTIVHIMELFKTNRVTNLVEGYNVLEDDLKSNQLQTEMTRMNK